LGGSLGGLFLARRSPAAGSGELETEQEGAVPLPNGYSFHRLFSTGDELPHGGRAEFLPGSAKITDDQRIFFHAADAHERDQDGLTMGLYEMAMDYGQSLPQAASLAQVVREGEYLDDGFKVDQVSIADSSDQGSVAVRIRTDEHNLPSLYLRSALENSTGNRLTKVLGYLTETPDGQGRFGGSVGNFDLHEGDDLLVAAHWSLESAVHTGEGLFHLPQGGVNRSGRLLLQTGDWVENSTSLINQFGLLHRDGPGGAYVVQVHTEEPVNYQPRAAGEGSGPKPGSAVLKDRIGSQGPASADLLAASRGTELSPMALGGGTVIGTTLYGPRIGPEGEVAHVVHLTNDHLRLYHHGRLIISTGDPSPTGRPVTGLGAPTPGRA
jgi:hypothetical protein